MTSKYMSFGIPFMWEYCYPSGRSGSGLQIYHHECGI